jgi:geranylgeranyl reductase
MKFDVVIVGGGPGGLHCARILADRGVKTALLERNRQIGVKVCAGGITRSGLMRSLPGELIQRHFSEQTVRTRFQSTVLRSSTPMVGTVDRVEMGVFMARAALERGAEIFTGARVTEIERDKIWFQHQGRSRFIKYGWLVGADGSRSKVRSFLGLDPEDAVYGMGMHYRVKSAGDEMVWNFDPETFGSGYSWIFPHRNAASVGAYLADNSISPLQLRKNLDSWLAHEKIDLSGARFEADRIHLSYGGWSFDRCFLVGDAAGLASPLTGEGINPAVLSGEAVAETILDRAFVPDKLEACIARHRKHWLMVKTAGRSRFVSLVLTELCNALLRCRLISFSKFEMA